MRTVELIYDKDCPNVSHARTNLLRGFVESGLPPRWTEWARGEPTSPDYVRGYGSPTILVDGRDVADGAAAEGVSSCRLYVDDSGELAGAPSVSMIAAALEGDRAGLGVGAHWRSSLATLPGITFASLPVCPACWPVYAGLVSSMGLGFLLDTAYALPLTILPLAMALAALAFGAKRRRGYGPFAVGAAASVIAVVGKFMFDSTAATYGGIVALIAASLWNAWPREARDQSSCPVCVPAEAAGQEETGNTRTTTLGVST